MPAAQKANADRTIIRRLLGLPEFRSARHIAVFLAFDGEPSLAPLIAAATARGKRLYAPIITRRHMHFAALDTDAALARNFFGILEPSLGQAIDARRLDLVLTPLVAFDDSGVRIGVGRGYYDRCFGFLRTREHWRRPRLCGVAYELQHVPPQTRHSWDIPLWGVVTETGVRRF